MSDPNAPRPEKERPKLYLPDPPKKTGLDTIAKVVLTVVGVGVLLAVLVFGTCVIALSR
jgi:hypothetical protein